LTKLPVGNLADRGAVSELSLTVKENGDVTGSARCAPRSGFAAAARSRFKDIKEQELDIYFQQMISSFGQGSKVSNHVHTDPADLVKPFEISLQFESAGYGVRQDDLLILELPGNPFEFGTTGFFPSMPEVHFPIQLPGQARVTTEFSIEIPRGFDVAFLPSPLLIENPLVYLELKPKRVENLIRWTQIVEIKGERVAVEDYAAIRDAYQRFVMPKNRLVMLEKKR
jgi:hypothetical protein